MIRRIWSAIDDYHGGDGAVAVPFCCLIIAIVIGVLSA
jgi:hypothetical protein